VTAQARTRSTCKTEAVPLLLVRHARAGNRSKWRGDDRLRPLTRKGTRQAEGLVGLLDQLGPERILSSPFVRCVQTVAPLAAARGLDVEEVEELEEGRGRKAVLLLAGLAGSGPAVVACTHGDVVLEALRDLTSDGSGVPPSSKGAVWVLERPKHGDGATARYLPAPS